MTDISIKVQRSGIGWKATLVTSDPYLSNEGTWSWTPTAAIRKMYYVISTANQALQASKLLAEEK